MRAVRSRGRTRGPTRRWIHAGAERQLLWGPGPIGLSTYRRHPQAVSLWVGDDREGKEVATTDLRRTYHRGPYGVAAVYDVVIGVVFLFFAKWAFESGCEPRRHERSGQVPLRAA